MGNTEMDTIFDWLHWSGGLGGSEYKIVVLTDNKYMIIKDGGDAMGAW